MHEWGSLGYQDATVMLPAKHSDSAGSNPPLALRMAAIAFVNQNVTVGCIWGSFSVLLGAVEVHLNVGRQLSTLAVPSLTLQQLPSHRLPVHWQPGIRCAR